MTIKIVPVEDSSLHLPRILCLHGGGVNAKIFRAQSRVLISQLKPYFRLCFVDAPFFSELEPGAGSVYRAYGPFRRWLRWKPEHPEIDAGVAGREIENSIYQAMEEDNEQGATGDWVALLGFSQGAKIAASLLLQQQVRRAKWGTSSGGSNFRFAVLLAGRGPLVSLDPELVMTPALADASQLSVDPPPVLNRQDLVNGNHVLRLPTIHVHGMRDPGLHLHRQLLELYCERSKTRLLEWDGPHRVPIKSKDIAALVGQILDLASETGIFSH